MKKVLITGATGNVGSEVIKVLNKMEHHLDIFIGVRDVDHESMERTTPILFDFTKSKTYQRALEGCEILFLVRPPQIADVNRYFKPLLETCIKEKVRQIVFLSVQGVEGNSVIPHHKIEKLIRASGIDFTFLRPAYFMQNFTTTLKSELVKNKRIYLPAGKARFTLVDVRDIGAVAANIITKPSAHRNLAYDLTSLEKLGFSEMATLLSDTLDTEISYESPDLIRFYGTKRKEKTPVRLIFVLIMLHYLPRFQKEPAISNWVEKILGRKPKTFQEFVSDHKQALLDKSCF